MKGIGIIGCGKIAQVRHIPEYAANPHAKIIGFYDLNTERARQLAEIHKARAFASIDELLADPQIDAVSICVANNAHAEVTIKALKAGKDVLCEKPMATTIEDCEAMVATAEAEGRKLMIGQNQRLAKAHAAAKDLIAQGRIGKVLTFRTTFGHSGPETWSIDPGRNTWFFSKERAAMGVMADLGIHKTDLIQYMLGQKVAKVSATVTTLDKKDAQGNLIQVDDNAICIYTMTDGSVGTMTASWTYYGPEDNSTVIRGTEGVMRIYDDPEHSIVIDTRDGEHIVMDVEKIQTNDNQTKSGVIDLFMECLEADREPEISGKDVLAAMKAVFAAIKSSEEGRQIEIL